MYIVGIGRTKFGKLPNTLIELSHKAINAALVDAQLSPDKIDFIFIANFLGGLLNSQLHLGSLISGLFPRKIIPSVRIEAACASGGTTMHLAMSKLTTAKNILLVGVEKMTNLPTKMVTSGLAMAGDKILDQQSGLIFPGMYALIAREYLKRYKLTHKVLEHVSYLSHKNANNNPNAQFFQKQVTLKDIKKAPLVASPLTLYDCGPISDGAVAMIISKEKPRKRGVKIIASSFATDRISLVDREDVTVFPATVKASREALKRAKISISKIDLFEIHDCFTISFLTALEDLKLAKPGNAEKIIAEQLEGKSTIGINTGGGLKADGHPIGATGLAQIFELTTQLRGEAGRRQHPSARYGLAQNIGGVGGTACITILKKI